MDPGEIPPALAERYRIERPIAGGAFGWVFEATQVGLDRRVALKLLHGERLIDPSHVKRFLVEAKLTAALSHPHIVRIIDHDVTDGVPWIAYELVTGGTLHDQIQHGPMEWPRALLAGAQVAAALECAHAAGVLHRDIKSKNVMTAGPDFWKVADFGLAKYESQTTLLTAEGALIGSPVYMAPELCRGEAASPASDLYATGVLLYELLVGEWPFSSPSPLVVLRMHINDPAPRPGEKRRGLPAGVDELVLRLLSKDPKARPATAKALREALEGLMPAESRSQLAIFAKIDDSGAPAKSTSDPVIGRKTRKAMRAPDDAAPSRSQAERAPAAAPGRAGTAAIALGALLAATAIGYFAGARGRPPEPGPPVATPSASARAGLTPAVRAALVDVKKEIRTAWDADKTFGEHMHNVADTGSFMGLSPAEADRELREVQARVTRYGGWHDRMARALAAAREQLGGAWESATADDLVPICAAATFETQTWLETERSRALARVLESMRKGTSGGIEGTFGELDTKVCYPPSAQALVERYAALTGLLCKSVLDSSGPPPAEWPRGLEDMLWISSSFENYMICGANRSVAVHGFAASATKALAGREDERAASLRELLEDLWVFGSQADPATTARRAQRALRTMERLQKEQPQCSEAWAHLILVTRAELEQAAKPRGARRR